MSMAGAMVQGRAAVSQGASRDARVKGDRTADATVSGNDESFRDVMSDLAETKRGETASVGTDSGAQKSALRPGQDQAASGDGSGEPESGDPEATAGDAASQTQTGPSLLEQVAMALAATSAATATSGTTADASAAAGVSGSEKGILSASRQLLSSLGAAASEGSGAGSTTSADAASLALAALNDNAADVTMPDSLAPATDRAAQAEAAGDAFPAMKVTVTGEETHFAPVKSAEETLNRLLTNPAEDAGTAPVEANTTAASRGGANATAKDGAALQLAVAGETAPVVATGEASSRRGGDEAGGEGRSAEGQGRAAAAEQQSARLAEAAATNFQTSAAAVGIGDAGAASPGEQIARRIAAELANPASRPSVVSSGSDGAVKVLHLQLEPTNLGSVTVRLSLKDDVISVHLEASRHETALAIEKDREMLSKALKSAGYVVDNITSQPGDMMRTNSQFQPQPVSNDGQMSSSLQSQGNSQQDPAQSGRGNQGDGGRQGPERGSMPAGINESRGEGSRAPGGALYV